MVPSTTWRRRPTTASQTQELPSAQSTAGRPVGPLILTGSMMIALVSVGFTRPAVVEASSGLDWPRIGGNLMKQLGTGLSDPNSRLPAGSHQKYQNRWVSLPSPTGSPATRRPVMNLWDQSRLPGGRPGNLDGRESLLIRAVNQVRNRIGSRNTIRVHNAFRDLAWRLLSGFSMPTPVIYELRRQHFYSPEEDAANDRFWNKNTTKTIRTRRQADDDDDEPESLRERLRAYLDDLMLLSRRSLFGRVIRVPSLFPFKRHEADARPEKLHEQSHGSESPKRRRRRRLSLVGRKRQEPERQMISINGKQYYVDDDGELKELKPSAKSAPSKTK